MKKRVIIGTDVSKLTLDHAIKTSEAHLKTANNPNGYREWLKWALGYGNKEDLWVVMEHTGYYSYQFELFLHRQEILYTKPPNPKNLFCATYLIISAQWQHTKG